MNNSVYDNVIDPNNEGEPSSQESVIGLVANDIFELLQCPTSFVYFCPFCVLSFSEHCLLKQHLLSGHAAFLWDLTTRSVGLDVCPFCPGKFVGYRLVAKHCLQYHLNVLVDAFFPKSNDLVKCIFCETLCAAKLMTFHLEVHSLDFDEWFKNAFPLQSGGVAGLVEIKRQDSSEDMHVDSLQLQMQQLNVVSSPKIIKSILKSPGTGTSSAKLPVRRVLTFSEDKENRRPPRRVISPGPEGGLSDLSWNTVQKRNKYQCGKCYLTFSSRLKLVKHMKKARRSHLSLLLPLYQCGLCNAKFYKSSFLERHCETHTLTPNPRTLR